MREFSIKISKVSNGYTLQPLGEDYKDDGITVYQQNDSNEFGELGAMFEVLYEVIQYFGVYGSKHDEKRLRVIIVNRDGEEIDIKGGI